MKMVKNILNACFIIGILIVMNACSKNDNGGATGGKSSAKAITAFAFKSLTPIVNASINEASKTITAIIPGGTDISNLVPSITISDKASVTPMSGTVQDFSKEVAYTVTAEDGSSQIYKVNTSVAAAVTKVIDCSTGATIPTVFTDLGEGVDYIVRCSISITNGAIVTINPGVTIQFEVANAGFIVKGGAALKMIGTATKPIILQGKTSTPGSWTGIQIGSENIDNQWQYVTLKDAGAGTYAAGLLISDEAYFLGNSQISIKNCTFTNNKGYGIWDLDNGYDYPRTVFTGFDSNTFTQNTNAPLSITADGIGKLDAKSTFSNNGQNYIEVHGKRGLFANTIVPKLSLPFLIMDNIEIHQRFNILPGVSFQFYTDAGFNLDAQYKGNGTFIANGTATNPISFTGYKSGKGVWLGLSLGNNDPEIILNYCMVDGAGSNLHNNSACICNVKGAVNFYPYINGATSKPIATNCTISNCGGYGIIYRKGSVINFTGNTYSNITLDNEKVF